MTSLHRVLVACGVCLAACDSVRIEDDGNGGEGPSATSAITTSGIAASTSASKSTSASATADATTTGGGGVTRETLQTGTTSDLHTVIWDDLEDGTAIVGGDGATILRLRAGGAPVPMQQGLVGGPSLRVSSLTQMNQKTFAGAVDGEGDRQFAHVLRFDDAWSPVWMPSTTCLEDPKLTSYLDASVIATCGYYPWLGTIDSAGIVAEAPDGFEHIALMNWPKWIEVLVSDGGDVHTIEPSTLERTNTWHTGASFIVTGILQDHLERPIALTASGDIVELGDFGSSSVLYPGDGNALRAGVRIGHTTTVFVGDAGKVLIMRGAGAPERLDVGVTGALRAIDDRYGHDQVAIVGDGGVAFVLSIH